MKEYFNNPDENFITPRSYKNQIEEMQRYMKGKTELYLGDFGSPIGSPGE